MDSEKNDINAVLNELDRGIPINRIQAEIDKLNSEIVIDTERYNKMPDGTFKTAVHNRIQEKNKIIEVLEKLIKKE